MTCRGTVQQGFLSLLALPAAGQCAAVCGGIYAAGDLIPLEGLSHSQEAITLPDLRMPVPSRKIRRMPLEAEQTLLSRL